MGKFASKYTDFLSSINKRIVDLEDSIAGRGGRGTFKVRNLIKELNNILVEIYNEYSPFLMDYEGYINFKKVKTEIFNESGTLIFSVQFNKDTGKYDGEFYDLIQKALGTPNAVTLDEYFSSLLATGNGTVLYDLLILSRLII